MIKHIILWQIKDEFSPDEKLKIAQNAKKALEALTEQIDGLQMLTVQIQPLTSSNADMMLESVFSSTEALANYQKHPLHVAAADTFFRPFMKARLCYDFDEI